MRVVLTSIGTRGDVQPMLALAVALRAAGHDAVLAAPAELAPLARRVDVPFVPVGNGLVRLAQGELAPRNAAGGVLAAWQAVRATLGHVLAETLEDTLRLCDAADVVVASGFHFLAGSVAEKLEARYAYAAPSPVSIRSAWYPPVFLAGGPYGRLWNRLGWRLSEQMANRTLGAALNAARAELGLPRVRNVLHAVVYGQPLLLAFSASLCPPAPDWPAGFQQTGAWYLDEPLQPSEPLRRFLAAGPPPVYVGFGSMLGLHQPLKTLGRLVEAARLADVRLLLGGDWGDLGGGGADPASRVLIAGDVPHAWLFQHVAAVVHHGGAGTTHAGLRAGRPTLILPHVGDQHWWARRVHALGAGPRPIPSHQLTADTLAASLRALLDPAYRSAAERLATSLHAEPGLSAAVQAVERL